MAPIAYSLITAESGKENEAKKCIEKIKGVEEAHIVFGVYDIVAKLHTDSMNSLDKVKKNIRDSEYVHSTVTMITTEGFKKSNKR